MREIKFRAFNKRTRKMDYGAGDLLLRINTKDFSEPMQFTGLADKNGTRIFEGDIIDVTSYHDDCEIYATVEWDNEEAKWAYRKTDGPDTEVGSLYDLLDPERDTVIGNIYKNPELLVS